MRKKRISVRIAIIIGIVQVLSMAVMITVGIYGMAESLQRDAIGDMNVMAKDRAALVESYIRDCTNILDGYSKTYEVREVLKNPDDPEAIGAAREFTDRYAENHDSIEGLYVAEWDTYVLAHINPDSVDQTFRDEASAKELEEQIKAEGKAYCTGIVLAPVTKTMVIPVYAPVYDNETGEAIGFAGAAFYTEGLANTLSELKEVSGRTRYSIINADTGIYIFNDNVELVGQECREEREKAAIDHFKNAGSGEAVWSSIEDGVVSAFYKMLDRNWIFSVEESEDSVFGIIITIQHRIMISGAVVTIIMVGLCILLIELAMRPLTAINSEIERLKNNDFSHNHSIKKYCDREDEYGTIANAVVELHGIMENRTQLYDEMLEAQTAGTLVTDAEDNDVVLINSTAMKLYGIDQKKKDTVTMNDIRERFNKDDLAMIEGVREKTMKTGEEVTFEAAVTYDDGKVAYLFNQVKAVNLSNGSTVVIFSVIDITERKALEDNLLVLSETDPMTGICNRRSGESRIGMTLREGRKGLFCLLDANKFKLVNDTFGHATGDLVLIAIAETMKTTFRKTDILIRLGGDEFAFFLSEVDEQELAERLIKKFMDAIETINIPELNGHKITVSLGAIIVTQCVGFSDIYNRADALMYKCKQKGGNIFETEW